MVDLLFYIFALLIIVSAIAVITARNSVHSVLFLIFAFFNAAAIFILIGAEYIAMTLVIVYVGAVAVLFLFVVMMLDIEVSTVKQGFLKYSPISLVLSLLIFINLYVAIYASKDKLYSGAIGTPIIDQELTNTEMIGNVLYTDYLLAFQMGGIILLVAMIGAIMLTLHHKKVKRQDICKQVSRSRDEAVRLAKVVSGQGVEL